MRGASRVTLAMVAWFATVAAAGSCREENLVAPDRNKPPDTFITGAPRERGEANVSVRFFWRGYDTDGVVVAYEVAIDDTTFGSWKRTTRTDSVFLFRVAPDDRDVSHTFYVAAVDHEGKRDPTAASRSFTAVDRAPPLVDVLWGTYQIPGQAPVVFTSGDTVPAPRAGEAPYPVIFHWTGSDADGVIVRYFWNIDSGLPKEIAYSDTATADAGAIPPKANPEDRARYILYVTTEDDAGLYGGEPPDGVLPARMEFAVDYTPRTVLDSVLAMGTHDGFTWDPVAYAAVVTPPETLLYRADTLATQTVTLPREAVLLLYWHSQDPEEGCVDSIRWVAPTAMFSGIEKSPWSAGDCQGSQSVGQLATEKLIGGPAASALRLWLRCRDSHRRVEEPGPSFPFQVNFPPVVTLDRDSCRCDTTSILHFRWHATDRDDGSQEVKYQVSLDGGSRQTVTDNLIEYAPADYDTTLSSHVFEVRASNDLQIGRLTVDTLTISCP